MNKWPRCEDCVRDNYLRAPVCQTCVAGSNFLPRGRSKIYYESVQEMNQPRHLIALGSGLAGGLTIAPLSRRFWT